jgi:hypothetical protein
MRVGSTSLALALPLTLCLASCGAAPQATAQKPAKAEPVGHETELLKLTLTPQAVQRLGIVTVRAGSGEIAGSVLVHGEIVLPPSGGGTAISASSDLATLAANQARADGDVLRTRAELDIAQKNAARAEALVGAEAGSVRARDEALAAAAVARANLQTARNQRGLFGPPISSIGRPGQVWVRVSVPAGDLATIDRGAPAQISLLGSSTGSRAARPIDGPPSASGSGAVDLYYALANPGRTLQLGQRVAVAIPSAASSQGLVIPAAAILHDIHGGEWVYVAVGKQSFERRRVDVASFQAGSALLARGLQPGAEVVTAGAAELFGTEFGTK